MNNIKVIDSILELLNKEVMTDPNNKEQLETAIDILGAIVNRLEDYSESLD